MNDKPEFWTSVLASQEIPPSERTSRGWALIQSSYDLWSPSVRKAESIPRIIHQIWLGSPLPRLYARWGETWKRHHPGWEYRLWTEKEIQAFGLKNRESFERSPNYGVKSDIARYEILERFGGIYADTDFECLGSFEELARSARFFAGLMYGHQTPINNGLIGSVPGHPILGSMMDQLTEPFSGHDGMDILAYSGPTQFSRRCLEFLETSRDGAVILPTTYFYAFPNQELDHKNLKTVKNWARPESLAIHYWEVSWRQQSLASRAYWWFKKRLPAPLVRGMYRILKGRAPSE